MQLSQRQSKKLLGLVQFLLHETLFPLCNSILLDCNSTNPTDPVYKWLHWTHRRLCFKSLHLCLASNSKTYCTLISSSCLVLALALSIYSTQKQQQKPNSEKCVFLLLYGKAKQSAVVQAEKEKERERRRKSPPPKKLLLCDCVLVGFSLVGWC